MLTFLDLFFSILQKLSLLVFGGNAAMWANKVSVVSNLVGSLTHLSVVPYIYIYIDKDKEIKK